MSFKFIIDTPTLQLITFNNVSINKDRMDGR